MTFAQKKKKKKKEKKTNKKTNPVLTKLVTLVFISNILKKKNASCK